MSSDGNALVTRMVAQFFEQRRAGQRPSIQDLAEAAGGAKLDDGLRSDALLAIARAARERTQTFGSSARSDRIEGAEFDAGALPELDGYDVIDVLGQGGMGIVYEAYQRSTGRRVAVKFLLEADAARDSARRRFEREVDLVARLNHPSIVSIIDSGVHSGRYYYVMEYVDGRPLDQALEPGICDPHAALALLAAIGDALDYAHQRGVLHRDIKPSNVLVVEGSRLGTQASAASASRESQDRGVEAKILDFGLAKAIDPTLDTGAARMTLSKPGQFVGTLAYVSPEQARGDYDKLSVRSDVYSLGAVAYELLTGQTPVGIEGGLRDVLNRIAEREPSKPSAMRSALSRDVDAMILKAIEKLPQKRYATAAEFAADIRRFLRGEPILARPIGIGERLWRRVRRDKRVSGAIAVGIIAVGATYAFGQYRVWVRDDHATRLNQSMNDLMRQASSLEDEPLSQETRDRLATWNEQIRDFHDLPAWEATLRESLGRTCFAYGDYENAQSNLETAWGIRKYTPGVAGQQDYQLADLQHQIALANYKLSLSDTAEAKLRSEVLPPLRVRANPTDPKAARSKEIATALCDLGRVLASRDRFSEADQTFQQAIAMHAGVANALGEADSRVYYSYCLDRESRMGEGIEQLQRALDIYRGYVGDGDHPRVANALLHLGNVQRRSCQIDAARKTSAAALGMYQRLYPAGHPQIVVCMNHVMLAEKEAGNFVEAIRLAEETLRLRIAAYPGSPTHDNIAVSRLNLGQVLSEAGRYEDAEREMLAARAIFEAKPDAARSHQFATSLHSLAQLYRRMGKQDDALRLCEEALRIRQDVYGDKPAIDVAASHYLRGRLLLDEDDATNAEPELNAAFEIESKVRPFGFSFGLYRYHLGDCRFRLNRFEEAEPDLAEGMRAIKTFKPFWTDPTPIDAVKRVIDVYERLDQPVMAEMHRKLLPPEGPPEAEETHHHP